MKNDNMEIWNKVCQPPKEALKKINGGRLSGMTDISPQWRIKAMTELFGTCGYGWKYEITKLWTEPASAEQVFAFVNVLLYIYSDGKWSDPIPGTGGSMLIAKEKAGLHSSDEAFKMATTDALSVAMKALGVGADIYMGLWDGSKYKQPPASAQNKSPIKTTEGIPASEPWMGHEWKNEKQRNLFISLVTAIMPVDEHVAFEKFLMDAMNAAIVAGKGKSKKKLSQKFIAHCLQNNMITEYFNEFAKE